MGYPVQLAHLEGRRVLVAGGGPVAAGKLEGLLEAGVSVHLVAPEVSAECAAWLDRVDRFERRLVEARDVEGTALVIAATDDRETNRRLADAARARGILVNAVDDPAACTFFAPAVVRRGPVTISISTDGASPLLAARLRRLFEALLPESITGVGQLFAKLRERGLKGLASRSGILRALADPTLGRLVDRGDTELASDRIAELAAEGEERFDPGTVAITGAGPGSNGLLTLRALDRIQRADVIFHDALVEPGVLQLALPGTRLVDVGRRAELPSPNRSRAPERVSSLEESIAPRLIREAQAGQRVVRLHAGDAMVFGRGGEELEALDAAGVRSEIIPGVSAVLAAPAALGVPLTHRGEARGFSVRTGHTRDGYSRGQLPKEEETAVILMGLGAVREIMSGLIAEGYAPDTPAAAVSAASRPNQKSVIATVATLADQIEREGLSAPATLLVGRVVGRARAQAFSSGERAA